MKVLKKGVLYICSQKKDICGSGDKNWYSFQPKVTDSNSNVVFPISEEISIEGYHLYDNGISNIKNIVDDLGITSFPELWKKDYSRVLEH